MKARRRFSAKFILLLSLGVSLFIAYHELGLLPGGLKNRFLKKMEPLLPFQVKFDKVIFWPWEGLSFAEAEILNKNGALIFSAKRLSLQAGWLHFFQDKKIIISNLRLDSPRYDFLLEPTPEISETPRPMTKISGQIPVPVIPGEKKISLNDFESFPNLFLPENVYLEQVQISNGRVAVRKNPQSPVLEEIESINLRMVFQKPPVVAIHGSIELGSDRYATLTLAGNWDLEKENYELDLNVKSLKVPDWLRWFQKENLLQLKEAGFTLHSRLKSKAQEKAMFHCEAEFKNTLLALRDTRYEGHVTMKAAGCYDFASKSFENYEGGLALDKVKISNLSKKIQELEAIDGEIQFKPDLLDILSLQGHYKSVGFTARGSIRSFKEPYLEARILSQSSIADILSLIPQDRRKLLQDFEIEGNCQAVTEVRGLIGSPEPHFHIEHKLSIERASIKNIGKKVSLTDLSAEIAVNDSGIEIRKGHFISKEKTYTLELSLPTETHAPGNFKLNFDDWKLSLSYIWENPGILIQRGEASSPGLSAIFQGRLSSLTDPLLTIQGENQMMLETLSTRFSKQQPWLQNLAPAGLVAGRFTLQGAWDKPLFWDFQMDGNAQTLRLKKKMQVNNLEFQIRMKDRFLKIPYWRGFAYGGMLGGDTLFDLSKPKPFVSGRAYGQNLNLTPLTQAFLEKPRDLAGNLGFQCRYEGFLSLAETYRGSGSLDIHDGKLWQTNLFKAMGSLPFVKIEGLDSVIFRNLSAVFEIHDKKFWTENFHVFGDAVDLSLKGSLGFDQSLDFLMDIQFSNSVMEGAFQTGGLVPFVVQEAADFISQYRISGTLKDPKYEKASMPVGRVIGKKLGHLFQGLAQ